MAPSTRGMGNCHRGTVRRKRRKSTTPTRNHVYFLAAGRNSERIPHHSNAAVPQLYPDSSYTHHTWPRPCSIHHTLHHFENLLEIALGKTQDVPNVANKDISEIIQYLRKKITGQILENVDVGLDPENPARSFTAGALTIEWNSGSLKGVSRHASTCKTSRRQRQVMSGRAFICANSPHFRVLRNCIARWPWNFPGFI